MVASRLQQIIAAWPSLSDMLHVLHTEGEYHETVGLLDNLIDQVGEDETHPLASLLEVLGILIEKYENDHLPEVSDV
jgi:HTH-type transcriptional regulator / antitoxin HigA